MKTNTITAVPRLRFPEFTDDKDWLESSLSRVCNMKAGTFVSASEIKDVLKDSLYPCYGGNGLRGFTKTCTHEGVFPLIGRQGALCGNITLSQGQFHATEHAVVCTPKKNIDVIWLYYQLVLLDLNQYATGQAQPGLSVKNLNDMPLRVPDSLKEQQKIADFLSSLDESIDAEIQQLNTLKDHKAGLLQNLFPVAEETTPKYRFPEFKDDGGWYQNVFKEVVSIIDGDRGKNYPKSEDFSQAGYCLFLSAKNVTKQGFAFEDTQFITEEKDKAMSKGKLKRNDIVLTTRGSVGQFAYYSPLIKHNNIRINSGMILLRADPSIIDSKYLYYFCQAPVLTGHIENTAYGNAQQQLNVSNVKSFIINYPKLLEQQRIADCLSSLDNLIESQDNKIKALKQHKQGLMQQLFPNKYT